MSDPTLRHLDSAAGVVVLLLLIVAVVSGQLAASSGVGTTIDGESWTSIQSGERDTSGSISDTDPKSGLSFHIVSAGLPLPQVQPAYDLRLSENGDDRSVMLND
ncbi:MAG: hypothetical protein RLN69_03680 [Woeseiaceae bacterium]